LTQIADVIVNYKHYCHYNMFQLESVGDQI